MSTSGIRKMNLCGITHQKCSIGIAFLEIIYSIFGLVGYWYASYTYPLLKQFVILPNDFLNDELIVGLINSLAILCGFEFLLAIALLDGTRFVKLGRIRFWITTMFTYKTLTCVLIVGMELAGCKAPKFNTYMFLSIFVRFVEMLLIYVFLEEETLRRMKLKIRDVREAMSSATSCSTISIPIDDGMVEGVSNDPNPEPILNGTNSSSRTLDA